MVRLTFYSGINEIGGNKILLEDGGGRLLLDFGFPYKRYKHFYEEYLKPRSGAGLLDLLTLELLPPLEGLYREDLAEPVPWENFRSKEGYRRLEEVDGVLLSHAHLDHSGHIALLRKDIPVYTTAMTAFISKAMQDSGKADFDQEVCYFAPRKKMQPTDWKQEACITDDKEKRVQRQFCIADMHPDSLSEEAQQFWSWGFYEKTPKQKALCSQPLADCGRSQFRLRCFRVDHSILGACAWAVETSASWIVYSGDLRLHGKRGEMTMRFIEEAAALKPTALIIEGTNVKKDENVPESAVYEKAYEAVRNAEGLVIADFSPRDVDRLLTFLQIARDTRRKLVILPKDAYLLKTVRLLEPETPDVASDDNILIYEETIATKAPSRVWMKEMNREYGHKVVVAKDVREHQGEFILCFSFFDLNELPSVQPREKSLYIYSSSEPHDEEQERDFWRLGNWLEHFDIKGFGLPVERGGKWEIPDEQKGLHASGHACGPDLLEVVRGISPKYLIPVHSEHPTYYSAYLKNSSIQVILPEAGGTIEL
ncbi:MAG: MBL fold metallo-hydrolase RNA specificity domain-containing protein [Candidatus Methanosuratincola sp.]